jgi:hypothetical protein
MNIQRVISAALGNMFVMLALALLAIKFLSPAFLWMLKTVLEALN